MLNEFLEKFKKAQNARALNEFRYVFGKDLTIIAIAHRESSLAFCDRIIEIF